MRVFYAIKGFSSKKWIHYHGFTRARGSDKLPCTPTEGASCVHPLAEVNSGLMECITSLFGVIRQYQRDMAEADRRRLEGCFYDGRTAFVNLKKPLLHGETPLGNSRYDVEGA